MRLFNRRPIIKRDDIPNIQKVAEFTIWFLKNEKLVNTLSEPSNNTIFNEGYRPLYDDGNNPEDTTNKITDLKSWFITKIYIDLNILQDSPKDEWKQFIDKLDAQGIKTLMKGAELAEKYNLDLGHFVYNREIEKIPQGNDMEDFKTNFLRDNVIGAEIRILAWLYLDYFSEPYKIKDNLELIEKNLPLTEKPCGLENPRGLKDYQPKPVENKPDGTTQYYDENGNLKEMWLPPEKIDELLKKYGPKRIYIVLIKGPWDGIKEADSTLFADDISSHVDEKGIAYMFCTYDAGVPKYHTIKKELWERWEEVLVIISNSNLSEEQRIEAINKLTKK